MSEEVSQSYEIVLSDHEVITICRSFSVAENKDENQFDFKAFIKHFE